MAAATLADIRAGLVANLAAVFTDVQVNAYELSAPTPPFLEIAVGDGLEYNLAANRGVDVFRLVVRAGVPGVDQAAGARMDDLLAPSGGQSVRAAIETDRTLGGVAHSLVVTGARNVQWVVNAASPGSTYLSAEWLVDVYVAGA